VRTLRLSSWLCPLRFHRLTRCRVLLRCRRLAVAELLRQLSSSCGARVYLRLQRCAQQPSAGPSQHHTVM
jgi:hypothetical protein